MSVKKFRVKYANELIDYALVKSKRSSSIRISIDGGGLVNVTIPFILPEIVAHKFVREKLDWIVKKLKQIKSECKLVLPDITNNEYKKYRLQAYELVLAKIEKFNRNYNFDYNNICIRDQKTRWGSCSSNRNLNFSYKMLFLEDHLVDYIVVHELCHLQEMNHSQDFWNLVGKSIKNYREIRRELKKIRIG
ncbi:M48 family metallopeptidase [Patescibacteria group bacterium]|nr:M48 family metallopeptidase [Patescibacteria group bacterium]